jgi:hypothetical protein
MDTEIHKWIIDELDDVTGGFCQALANAIIVASSTHDCQSRGKLGNAEIRISMSNG